MSGGVAARWRSAIWAALTVVILLGSGQGARAGNCFVTSGNPFLAGFSNGVLGQIFCNGSDTNPTIDFPPSLNGVGLLYFEMINENVTGNVTVAKGTFLANGGIAVAPAAVQAQIVAFNLAHGIPADYEPPFNGLHITQSTISGQVINNGLICGLQIALVTPLNVASPTNCVTSPTIAPNVFNFPAPELNGIFVATTSFTGASAGIVNNGTISSTSGAIPFNGLGNNPPLPGAFTPLTVTGIRLDTVQGNFGTILNNGTVTSDSFFTTGVSATPATGIGIQLNAPTGTATGTVVNASSLEASGTGSFPQAVGIQVGGSLGATGVPAAGPNGGTLVGDITNGGIMTVSVTGAANGNAGADAVGIRVNLATTSIGGAPGLFNGNIFNSGMLNVSASGTGLAAHGIDIGASGFSTGTFAGQVNNSGVLLATGTNGATGTGIVAMTPVGGGILNTGMLAGSTAAIDLTQETGGATAITQAGGATIGNILGSGADTLAVTGGKLVLAPTGVVNGLSSFTMGTSGTLTLQVTPTQAGHITVNGAATLQGGTVEVQPQGVLPGQTKYTILTALGGVHGTFANAVSDLPFLLPTLSYDANDAFLTLGVNPTSGEIHASVQTSLIDDSAYMREAVLGRLRQQAYADAPGATGMLAYGGPQVATAPDAGALAYVDTRRPAFPLKAVPVEHPEWTWWSQAVGAWGLIEGGNGAAELRRDLSGVFSGVDRGFGHSLRAGLAAGYTHSGISVDARTSSANVDTAHLAAYAGTTLGALDVRTGAALAIDDIGTSRAAVGPSFSDADAAHYTAVSGQVFGEVGHAMTLGGGAVEPFAGLAWVHLARESFTEAGGTAAVAGSSLNEDVGYSSLGVRLATSIAMPGAMALVPRASATWGHAFGDVNPTAALTLSNFNTAFTTFGVPLATDTAIIDTGLDLVINPRAKVGIAYVGHLAPSAQDHAVKGGFTWKF